MGGQRVLQLIGPLTRAIRFLSIFYGELLDWPLVGKRAPVQQRCAAKQAMT